MLHLPRFIVGAGVLSAVLCLAARASAAAQEPAASGASAPT